MSTPAAINNKTQLHKTVVSSSKDWVSPFRTGQKATPKKPSTIGKEQPVSKEKEVVVPADAEVPEDDDVDAEEPLEKSFDNDAIVDDDEEPLADHVDEENNVENNAEEVEEVEEVAETPIADAVVVETEVDVEEVEPADADENAEVEEDVTADTATDAAVDATEVVPQKEVLEEVPEVIKTHPKMLQRYKENFNIASNIMNHNHIENLTRRVNLGAGLVLTEQQIYELARKKLEPTMKQIDARVAENNARDAAKAFKIEEDIRLKDEAVVAGMLADYKALIEKKKQEAQKEHDDLFQQVEDEAANSKAIFEKHIKDQTDGIAEDDANAKKEEEEAVENHVKSKMDLLQNHEQYKLDKQKELEDVKAKQIEESEASKKFESDTVELKEKLESLEKELSEKKKELEEKIKKVESLIATKHEKQQATSN